MSDRGEILIRQVRVRNRQGLHARSVMRFVDVASRFSAEIRVDKGLGTEQVDGRSPMEMMLLEASRGTALRMIADGEDAGEMLDALEQLVNNCFGEEVLGEDA